MTETGLDPREGSAASDLHPTVDLRERLAPVTSVLDDLERLGAGRWSLSPADDVDTREAGGPFVVVARADGTGIARVRPADRRAMAAAEEDPERVATVASILTTVAELEHRVQDARRRAEQAEAASATDALTGLANARGWWQVARREAARCARQGLAGLVVVVDLDDLKAVNDANGHLAGDVLLRITARTLLGSVRATDLVARIGGDEFAVLAVDYGDEPRTVVRRIREALGAAGIRASVGGAVHTAGQAVEDTFQVADQAMYEVKRRRRGP